MFRPIHGIYITLLLFVLLPFASAAGLAESPELQPEEHRHYAENGVLDLRDHDFTSKYGLVEMVGDWEFYPNRFLRPGEDVQPEMYLPTNYRWDENQDLPTQGYGSYRLTILLPEHPPKQELKLFYREVGSSAQFIWNSHVIAQTGHPASTPGRYQGEWRTGLSAEAEYATEVELIVHVANFDSANGGIIDAPILGSAQRLEEFFYSDMALNYTIAGVLLIMGVYHLFIFFIRSSEEAPFWFAVAAIWLGIRALAVDNFAITIMFPGILIEETMRLNYLSFCIPVLSVSLFVHFSYPSPFGKVVAFLSALGSGAYAIAILVFPPSLFSSWLFSYQVFALGITVCLFAIVIWAVLSRKPFAGTFSVGFLAIGLAAIYDILKTIFAIPSPSLTSYGMVLFVVILAFNLSRRSNHALDSERQMSDRLSNINQAMERFVPREFLQFLKKEEITEIELGDNSEEFLTVLFADLVGFSEMASNTHQNEIFNLINGFLAEMGPIIRKHNGFVDKYMGDGIMALFPGNASNAIQAAIEMQHKLDNMNETQAQENWPKLHMGIGIHSGTCVLGTIGEVQRMDTSVISDAVNMSNRLQDLTRPLDTRILISAETHRLAVQPERFYVRKIGNIPVKGRQEGMEVMEVINADPPSLWKQKRSVRRDFERAVGYQLSGEREAAHSLFTELSQRAPDDGAVRWYLKKLNAAETSDGVHID